jgi:hypothetical protein
MSTCFLGLMPHLQESERQIKVELNSSSPEDFKKFCLFLDSNLLILIGFLLIVLIEQSAVFCLPKSTSSTNSTIRSPTKRSENIPVETSLISQSDNQPLVRFNSSGTDSDSDGDLGRIEFRTTNSNNVSSYLFYIHLCLSHMKPQAIHIIIISLCQTDRLFNLLFFFLHYPYTLYSKELLSGDKQAMGILLNF